VEESDDNGGHVSQTDGKESVASKPPARIAGVVPEAQGIANSHDVPRMVRASLKRGKASQERGLALWFNTGGVGIR
jgi:hypothetical protein